MIDIIHQTIDRQYLQQRKKSIYFYLMGAALVVGVSGRSPDEVKRGGCSCWRVASSEPFAPVKAAMARFSSKEAKRVASAAAANGSLCKAVRKQEQSQKELEGSAKKKEISDVVFMLTPFRKGPSVSGPPQLTQLAHLPAEARV